MDTLFRFPNVLKTPGSLQLPKALKLMARKGNRVVLHRKGLEPKYAPRLGGQISLGYYANTKDKPKVQLPTKVAPKEENYPMLETKKVALFYQGKSCLCHGWYVRLWSCDTKAHHVSAACQMLGSCLVVQRQILSLP